MTDSYQPLFTPRNLSARKTATSPSLGDRTSGAVYVFNDAITLAVNVALATGRPLLVRGTSGSGKTSLARSVAAHLECEYREAVITARTQARDLLWTTDLLRRLQDAQMQKLSSDWGHYVVPGPLWWSLDPVSAARQMRLAVPGAEHREPRRERTVLLIDEIDKADPDVPNSLLRPLGDLAFEVEETGQHVVAQPPPPLIVITTNEERDLPPAFLRRCVELAIPTFDRARLIEIGAAHIPQLSEVLLGAAADLVVAASARRDRREPNPAEYLDILRASRELGLTPDSTAFTQLTTIALGTGPT
jgi:MoxR-like ATPase